VDIAGIKVGQISGVKLEDGHAVVSMSIDNKYAPLIHDNASLLLRPKTGLNDMVVEVDPGTPSSPDIKEDSTVPLASTQPQVNPDEFPRNAGCRHPDVPEAAAVERGGGSRSSPGPRREALQRPAPPRSVRPEHLRDLGGSGGPPGEHRELDPQLPAPVDRAREPRSGPSQLRRLLERGARLVREGGGLASQRRPGAAGDAQGDEGGPDQRQCPGPAVRAGPEEVDPGRQGDRPGAPRPPAVLPADRRSDREPDPAVHHAGRQSRDAHRADLAGPGHRDAGLEDGIHRPEPRPERARVQPAGLRERGLPLLRPLAEPQPGGQLHASGRLRADAPRCRPGQLLDGLHRRRHAALRALPAPALSAHRHLACLEHPGCT